MEKAPCLQGRFVWYERAMVAGATLFRQATLNGVEYSSDQIVFLNDGIAVIVCICEKCPNDLFLVRYQIPLYDPSVGAFHLTDTDGRSLAEPARLTDPQPM